MDVTLVPLPGDSSCELVELSLHDVEDEFCQEAAIEKEMEKEKKKPFLAMSIGSKPAKPPKPKDKVKAPVKEKRQEGGGKRKGEEREGAGQEAKRQRRQSGQEEQVGLSY